MTLGDLRKLILDIENKPSGARPSSLEGVPEPYPLDRSQSPWTFGIEEVDLALPDAQLCAHGFHDISAEHPGDRVAAGGFAMALLSKLPGGW